jgi:Asparagine synthase
MDLNIGTAFWFASRGTGYIQDYHSSDLEAMYSTENSSGRPLLRVGEDGAARGVGRVDRVKNAQSKTVCSIDGCGRYAKDRCILRACGRCCVRRNDGSEAKCSVHKSKKDDVQESGEVVNDKDNAAKDPITNVDGREDYQAECRVLLVGIGADEHLAGYGRHRTVYSNEGVDRLHRELVKDQTRLWERNLGRDDRCISDHGKEAWFPYLDERLVGYLHSLNINDIADFSLGQGEGDKLILRDASRLMGLTTCTELVKRAIQFGTKIAKLTNVEYHGSNRRGSGEDQI